MNKDIAIIGMSALFPGASCLQEYWENILNKVDGVVEAPDEWAKPYYDPNSTENDRIYTRKGGFLGKLAAFNPIEFGIMPNSVKGGDPDHFLALKQSREALLDAGYAESKYNLEKTGIILGRGTYINRGWGNLLQQGMIVDQTLDLLREINPEIGAWELRELRREMKSSLLPLNAETVPGLVPNVLTGRIANRLGLMGPNYIIDGACASSLIAVELGIKELLSGRCDMMLAGGVQAPSPPQLHMLFTQLGALSHEKIRPFDRSADGTLLGEGLGIVVLKRLADAQKDGDRIYAAIAGVGSSSDGKALGLLAPRLEGEVLAIDRAYRENNINPDTITLIEAHGTGIPLGDSVEIKSLRRIFGDRSSGRLPHRALGAVKSMIGHCTIAAGAAGLIKTALALYHKILPPTLCDRVNPALEIEKTSFYINNETRPWIHREVNRRAGVNAFGFGGVNAHAILEEYRGPQPRGAKLLHKQWPTELIVLSGDERSEVVERINKIQVRLEEAPDIALSDLAYSLSRDKIGSQRLAIIAKDIPDLQVKLNRAVEKLKDKRPEWKTRSGIYYREIKESSEIGKTAFLFPGEGAQYANMLADLCLYFPKVRAWFDFLDETFASRDCPPSWFIFPPPTASKAEKEWAKKGLFTMDVASEAVFIASMALQELLLDLGVQPEVIVGHSTGELAAAIAAGVVRIADRAHLGEKMRYLNQIYRQLETSDRIPKGVLLTVGAVPEEAIAKLLEEFDIHLAIDNCPNQVVLFGRDGEIALVEGKLKSAGGIYARLPFDRAYHTALFAEVGKAFRAFYDALEVGPGKTPLYSCATSREFPEEPEAIRTLAAKQWYSRVRFRETIVALYSQGVRNFIEVGPSGNLTGFVDDILKGKDYLALASNRQRQGGLAQIQHLIGRLWVQGMAINQEVLYRDRELSLVNLEPAVGTKKTGDGKSQILDLNMPVMRIKPDFVQTLSKSEVKKHQSPIAFKESQIPDSPSLITSYEDSFTKTEALDPGTSHQDPGVWSKPVDSSRAFPVAGSPQTPRSKGGFRKPPLLEGGVWGGSDATSADHTQDPVPKRSGLDPRLSIVTGHFELMQEFLASQERVSQKLYSNPAIYRLEIPEGVATINEEAAWPLLGTIVERNSDYLQAQRHFDLERDLFLQDHTLGGKLSQRDRELLPLPVMPFTLSMEMMAEAASYLLGGDKVVLGLSEVRGYRWLALDRGKLTVEIRGRVEPQGEPQMVQVQLWESSDLLFESRVRLADKLGPTPEPKIFPLEGGAPSRWSDKDLYRMGMFHGLRFQGVKHIREWSQSGIEAEVETIAIDDFFRDRKKPVFQIDGGMLDAATQLAAFWVTEQFGTAFHLFPFHLRAFHQYTSPLPPGTVLLCRGQIGFIDRQRTEANFEFIDQNGKAIASMEGLQSIYFPVPHPYARCRINPLGAYFSHQGPETGKICRRIEPISPEFWQISGGICQRAIAHLMLNRQERALWYSLPETSDRVDWLLGRIAAKDALRQWAKETRNLELAPVDVEIITTAWGETKVRCPPLEAMGPIPEISMDHRDGDVVATIAGSR